ncbi:hypothetical protein K2X33_11655 [bacterium]|nr:hypothetical protein [bacterium]
MKTLLAVVLAVSSPVWATPDFERAAEIIHSATYIPFTLNRTGCEARALYLAMELAAKDLPSRALVVSGDLRPQEGIRWPYHVALLLSAAGEGRVVDLSLSALPFRPSEFLAALQRETPAEEKSKTRQRVVAGSVFAPSVLTEETAYVPPQIIQPDEKPAYDMPLESFDKFPAFQFADTLTAYRTLWAIYSRGDLKEAGTRDAEQDMLTVRTRTLLELLEKKGKLEGFDKETFENCAIDLHRWQKYKDTANGIPLPFEPCS